MDEPDCEAVLFQNENVKLTKMCVEFPGVLTKKNKIL
jgi:hypothetical protein